MHYMNNCMITSLYMKMCVIYGLKESNTRFVMSHIILCVQD